LILPVDFSSAVGLGANHKYSVKILPSHLQYDVL